MLKNTLFPQRWLSARYARLIVPVALLLAMGFAGTAAADQSSSAHYKVSETQFNAGSTQGCSGNVYCAQHSVGDTVDGSARSANFSAQFGFIISDIPVLEVSTVTNTEDMGVLDTDKTGIAEASVGVRSYLSNGYIIQVTGPPPSQGSHSLTASTTPTLSTQNTEQFGINLVANTTPAVGADPVQDGSDFTHGVVTTNYNQPNKYMYKDGDIVAESTSSTGQTIYTVSFIANITNVTPAGQYKGDFSAVVVPLY